MRNLVFWFLLVLGLLIALFGVGVDYIMPGASPGLNVPQLSIIVFGLILAFGARQLRRNSVPRWLTTGIRKNGVRILVITLITFLCLEIVLSLIGMPTYYPTAFSDEPLEEVPWWTCDEQGCRFVYAAAVSACENGELRGRACIVNQQGYPDTKDFTVESGVGGSARILFLGDSFTRGWSADVGKSYVETVEKNLPEAVVWNAAIGGTGTNQAVATFANLGPLFQPQLTILGFYLNDFTDNLFPLDAKHRVINEDGHLEVIRNYYLDAYGNAQRLPVTQSLVDFARAGKLPIPHTFERLVGNTRLGSLFLELRERLVRLSTRREPVSRLELEKERTREYLNKLRQNVASRDSELLLLIINQRKDMPIFGMRYETAIELMQELEIPYLDTTHIIQTPDGYAPLPDVHWNNSGHQKVGALLSDCVEKFIASGNLHDCSHVVAP